MIENENNNLSLSPDHNTSRSIKHINDCIDYDNSIREFYEMIANSEDVPYYRANIKKDISSASLFSLNSSSPFPSIVKTHYQFSEEIAICGCLPSIDRYYYVIDNKLFLWRTSSKSYESKNVEQIMEDEKVILAVNTIERGRDRYFIKTIKSLLAVATPTYIRVYPLENDILRPSIFYTFKINFLPTCMCSGDWCQLFIGAADGQLYSLKFKPQTGWFQKEIEDVAITNLTAGPITNALISFFSLTVAPIYKICYDQTSGLLLTIDNTQRIRIYTHDNEKVTLQYTYNPPKGKQFVSVSPIYYSDSRQLRFVVFTSKGERLFFGHYQTRFRRLNVGFRAEKSPPTEIEDETVVDAIQQCGYTAFICKESIVGLQLIHTDKDECYELVGITKLSDHGISISALPHPLCHIGTSSFHSPIVNQHFLEPLEFFILTTSGGCSVKFRPPCFQVNQQFINEKFQYDENCNKIMTKFISNDESSAMCLLLASIYPEESENLLFISSEFDRLQTLNMKIQDGNEEQKVPIEDDIFLSPDRLTPMTHAFYVRAQRLVSLIWECPVFDVDPDGFVRISPEFSGLNPDILKRLNQVLELSQEYISNQEKSKETFDEHRLFIHQIESDQLESLQTLLKELIETLKFIRILRKQKTSLLTMAMDQLDRKARIRLEREPFCPTFQTKIHIITALRKYAISLVTEFKNVIDTQSKNTLKRYAKYDNDPYSISFLSPDEVPLIRSDIPSKSTSSLSEFQIASQAASAEPWIRMEAGLHLLTSEISNECPSFLNSPEALIIRAKLDLQAATKEPDLTNKKSLAHSACKTFLTYINIDEDEDNLSRICGIFISLGFPVYAVKIAVARAHFVDDAQLGYYWYINGCNEEEFNSKEKFEIVSRIYESVFDAAYTDEGMKEILETNDELFTLLIFQHLLHTDDINRLLNIDSKLVLDFLKENSPDLVWKFYVAHKQYKEAVLSLIKYASDASTASSEIENDDISFDQRIVYLQKAVNYARKENYNDLASEAQIRIECARIQKEMYPELVGEPLKNLTILFKDAEKKYLWSFSLRLASLMKIENFSKHDIDMKTLWINFLLCGDGSSSYLNEKPTESEMSQKLIKIFAEIGVDKDALNPDYLAPAFEEFANYRDFRPEWAVETLTMLKVDGSKLYKSYVKLIDFPDLSLDRRNQLIFAALWLLAHGFTGDISLIEDKIKNVLEDPKNPYYDEIHDFMK